METRPLGNTGLRLPVLSFGASSLGQEFRDVDVNEALRSVHVALDLGMNFIDTSPFYGRGMSEVLLGVALRDVPRDRYILGTKLGRYSGVHFDFSARRVVESVDVSLERMRVDHLDIILCHDIEFVDMNQIVEETPSGEFVPDLLLSDSSGRSPSLFVEIAVTHLLSERKRSSGGRIIEIGLDSEDDLGVIRGRRLTPENARFVNFAPESEKLTDSECRCAERQTYAFVVLSNGKCYLDRSTAADLVSRARRQRGRVGYFRLFDLRHFTSETDFLPPAGEVFRHAVRQARHEGFRFKNCYLCRHQGDNYFGDEGKPIFCKRRFIRCNSNAAVDCDEFESRPLGDDHVQL